MPFGHVSGLPTAPVLLRSYPLLSAYITKRRTKSNSCCVSQPPNSGLDSVVAGLAQHMPRTGYTLRNRKLQFYGTKVSRIKRRLQKGTGKARTLGLVEVPMLSKRANSSCTVMTRFARAATVLAFASAFYSSPQGVLESCPIGNLAPIKHSTQLSDSGQ